jgi:hypothetical protein
VTCEELRRDAAGIAALSRGDPEREAAFDHARGCAGCAAALRAGERLISMLDALPPEPAPSAAVLRRAASPVLESLPPVRPALALPVVAAATSVLVVLTARILSGEPRDWVAAVALAVAAAGLAVLAPRHGLGAVAAIALSFLVAFAGSGPGPIVPLHEGVRCASIELAAAAATVAVALALSRGDGLRPGRLAAVAAAGALAAQAALEVACKWCDVSMHVLVFHAGTVVVAALGGALVGALRARPAAAS